MVIENTDKHGPAKNWPTDSEIFDGESFTDAAHLGQGLEAAACTNVLRRGPDDQGAHRTKEMPAWGLLSRRKDKPEATHGRRLINPFSMFLWLPVDPWGFVHGPQPSIRNSSNHAAPRPNPWPPQMQGV